MSRFFQYDFNLHFLLSLKIIHLYEDHFFVASELYVYKQFSNVGKYRGVFDKKCISEYK